VAKYRVLGARQERGSSWNEMVMSRDDVESANYRRASGNHGSSINLQNKYPVQDDEYNYHDSLQAHSKEGLGHVRYINVLTWIRGFRAKIASFQRFFCLLIPKRDLDTRQHQIRKFVPEASEPC